MAAPWSAVPWRVAVTRDEDADGPLTVALRAEGFVPVPCPVLVEAAPRDPARLAYCASRLEEFDWIVVASVRAVRALTQARLAPWPPALRTAAVGRHTADALLRAGADAPVVGYGDGADALWSALDAIGGWTGQRVLVPTTPGGRRFLADALTAAGAVVTEVESYRMQPRSAPDIASSWTAAGPDAAVIASPRVAHALVAAVGAPALTSLAALVAIGATTAAALAEHSVPCVTPATADWREAARALAGRRPVETSR